MQNEPISHFGVQTLSRRRMIMDYLPALLRSSESKRESAMRLIIGALQMPATKDNGGIFT